MRIAIPVDENRMESGVCISFGRAPYFLIHDTKTKENVFLENHAATGTGGTGIKAAQAIVDSKADVLLTPRCGENAAGVLKAAGIELYQTAGDPAAQTVCAFIAGKLSPLEEIHAGHHGQGGS